MDWREIKDDREKYQAYLCSREWAEKKEAVHARAGGKCERCKVLQIAAVHHLTYVRKYAEPLEDLQAICQPCHEFTHGKHDYDPREAYATIRFLMDCKRSKKEPMPFDVYVGISDPEDMEVGLGEVVRGAMILHAASLGLAASVLLDTLPFLVPHSFLRNHVEDMQTVSAWWKAFGFDETARPEWLPPSLDEKE